LLNYDIMSSLNSKERLDLKKLISESSDCTDNTQHIRNVKHSVLIRNDIRTVENLKMKERKLFENDKDAFRTLCEKNASFLSTMYLDIFNRLLKNELDLTIMTKLLTVLKLIEDGKVDQHEGSVMVGKILKELYIDSAIKHGDNLDKQREGEVDGQEKAEPVEGKKISWKEFKNLHP